MVALLKMPKGLSFTNFIGTNPADAEGAERRMFPRKEIRPGWKGVGWTTRCRHCRSHV